MPFSAHGENRGGGGVMDSNKWTKNRIVHYYE